VDIKVKIGETLDRVFTLYADDAGTVPLDLSGWTAAVVLSSYGENEAVSLTLGAGLTQPTANTLRVTTAITATAFNVGLGRWRLQLVSPKGTTYFPENGKLIVGAP
jgi:hypothetical protein